MNEISDKLRICLTKFEIINQVCDYKTKVNWFKNFCENLSDLLISIAAFIKNSSQNYVKSIKKSLLLYLTQLTTLLSLLIKVFLTESELKENIHDARSFIIKQLHTCFTSIETVLKTGESNEPHGSFLKFMDLSLDKLSEIDVETNKENVIKIYDETKNYVEEVMCYAMSIAQVCRVDDLKIIKGACKAVLDELEGLHTELKKSDLKVNFCNLFLDCCYDKLCALEKKVNLSVLRLSLDVFSRFALPIEELNDYCLNRGNVYDEERLDDLVANLDAYVDCIMQIGLFAISASTDPKIGVRMKSCLASLEALETELVPSLNQVLLNPSIQNKNYSYILEQFWVQQANSLKELIYDIVDPFAFCQVVYEELKQHIDRIDGCVKNNDITDLNSGYFDKVVRESYVLTDLVSVSISEMILDNKEDIKRNISEIKIVLHEIKSANTLLLANKMIVESNNLLRVVKRVKILKGSVRKLLFSLSNSDLKNDIQQNSEDQKVISNDSNFEDNQKINELLNRGKELLSERSILYRTPKKVTDRKCQTTAVKRTKKSDSNKPMSLLKSVQLRNMRFSYSRIANENFTQSDLQITDILNDLENISSSFSNTF